MRILPFAIDENRYNVFVVIDDESLARIKAYDPAQFDATKLPPEWKEKTLATVIIGYATTEDLALVEKLLTSGAPGAALQYLARGFQFKPQAGDHDGAYTKQ